MLQTTIVTDLSVFDQDDDDDSDGGLFGKTAKTKGDDDSDGGLFGNTTKTNSLYDTSTDDLFDFA